MQSQKFCRVSVYQQRFIIWLMLVSVGLVWSADVICTHHARPCFYTRQYMPSADSHVPLFPHACGLQAHLLKLQNLSNDSHCLPFIRLGKQWKLFWWIKTKGEIILWWGEKQYLDAGCASKKSVVPALCFSFFSLNSLKQSDKVTVGRWSQFMLSIFQKAMRVTLDPGLGMPPDAPPFFLQAKFEKDLFCFVGQYRTKSDEK